MATTAPPKTKVADEVPNSTLTPPDPVPVVAAEKAAGLVPVDEGKKSKLDDQVDVFVEELPPRSTPLRPNSARRSTRSPIWAARKSPRRLAAPTASSTGRSRR